MRLKLLRQCLGLGLLFFVHSNGFAQLFSFNCSRDTVLSSCTPNPCFTLQSIIPDLHSLSDSYSINPSSSTPGCFPVYVQPDDPAGTPTLISIDDQYTSVINLPFSFVFFGTVYNSLVVSTNGVVCFDISKAGMFAHFTVNANLPSATYDRAIIMGPYHDLFPGVPTSPTQRIQYQAFGTAPHRRWILSFYKVPLFGCTNLIQNTHQIVLYESTGIVEVSIFDKQICLTSQAGKAIVGMQDFTRTKWVMAPNRTQTSPPWGTVGMNESWRFVPNGGGSLFKRVELYNLAGTLLSTGTTTNSGNGTLIASFPSTCPSPTGTTTYVVKSVYQKIDDPTVEIYGNDTVNVSVTTGLLEANTSSQPTSCSSSTDGKITVTPITGIAPFTYSLDGGAFVPGPTPYTFTNVSAGLHTIRLADASGCSGGPFDVTVNAGSGPDMTMAPTGTSCPAAANGSIVVTATAGTAPFTYQLDANAPVAGGSPYTFTSVGAGLHTIKITDAFGCSNQKDVTVPSGPILTATLTNVPTTCSGATNASITVTPASGVGPYTYSLDGGPFVPGPTPYTFTNVSAGIHTIVLRDASGCESVNIPTDVPPGPALTTNVSKTDALCNGGTTGTITVAQPAIGVAPFQYSLNNVNWQVGNTFTGLAAGLYTVYFRDNSGCQNSQTITINEPPALVEILTTTPVLCNGESNGIINVNVSGGTGPYEYSINNGVNWQTSPVFNVSAGFHLVLIHDAVGCLMAQSIIVTEPNVFIASGTSTNASCDGGNDGVITVTASGGNTGYQYSINGINYQSSNIFNVAPGPYTVRVKDNLGCNAVFPITVGLTTNLSFTPQTDPTICEGTSTQLQLNSNATLYAWTPGTGLSSTSIANPIANPTSPTQYIVTATLGRCSANDTVFVNVNPAPTPVAGAPGFICYGQTYQLNGSGGTTFAWTPSTYLSSSTVFNPVATPAQTITYTLSVIDAIGCHSIVTDQVTVDVTPPIHVNTFPYDTLAHPGDQFQLLATSAAPNYVWTPSTGLSDVNIPNPVLTVGAIGSDLIYKVTAFTAAGCIGEGFVTLRVYKGPDIYVPTGFSPNNDGKNDKFTPFPVSIKQINYFRVFNRWGQLIFSTNKLHDGWDGKLGGKEQASGVYVWMVEGITKDGKLIRKNGTVLLVR